MPVFQLSFVKNPLHILPGLIRRSNVFRENSFHSAVMGRESISGLRFQNFLFTLFFHELISNMHSVSIFRYLPLVS